MSKNARDEAKTEFQAQVTDPKAGALKKYMDIVLGKRSLLRLFKYEIIMLLCNSLPGMFGYAMRKFLYPRLLGSCGRGTQFGRNITIRHPHKIHIGDNCIIDDYCVLDAKGDDNTGITIGNNVIIARNTALSCKGGYIKIDDNSNISLNCMIISESKVELGKNILIAAYCYIIGGGAHDFERTDIPIIQQSSTKKGIFLEDNLWLGAGVFIMDGVTVHHDSVIGAGAIVNKDIEPWSIAVGAPARVLRKRQHS